MYVLKKILTPQYLSLSFPYKIHNPEPLLDTVSETLWSQSSTDTGPIKIQIYERKLLLNAKQYSSNPEAIQGVKPITEDYLEQDYLSLPPAH